MTDKDLGRFLVEVIEETLSKNSPVSLEKLRLNYKKNWKDNSDVIAPANFGQMFKILNSNEKGKQWLQGSEENVLLFEADTILTNYFAVDCLLIAEQIDKDSNGLVSLSDWNEKCQQHFRSNSMDVNNFTPQSFIEDYKKCEYVSSSDNSTFKLNLKNIERDLFYLREARETVLMKQFRPNKIAAQVNKKKAWIVIVVSERTNLNSNAGGMKRKEILAEIKRKFRTDINPGMCGKYVDSLCETDMGRVWLDQKRKQSVILSSHESTLADSRAIEALCIALSMSGDGNSISKGNWQKRCQQELSISKELSRKYLDHYMSCQYLESLDPNSETIELDKQHIERDRFFLEEARRANLRHPALIP